MPSEAVIDFHVKIKSGLEMQHFIKKKKFRGKLNDLIPSLSLSF